MSDETHSGDRPYETEAPTAQVWTDKAYELLVAGDLEAVVNTSHGVRRAVVTGDCPYCTHDVAFDLVLDAVPGEGFRLIGPRGQRTADEYVSLAVTCRCNGVHPGRPKDVVFGCGVSFSVDVLADGSQA